MTSEQRTFPVLNSGKPVPGAPKSVPWSLVAPHEAQAQKNHGQSLAQLARRGGLSLCELAAVLENRPWHHMLPDQAQRRIAKIMAERLPQAPRPPQP